MIKKLMILVCLISHFSINSLFASASASAAAPNPQDLEAGQVAAPTPVIPQTEDLNQMSSDVLLAQLTDRKAVEAQNQSIIDHYRGSDFASQESCARNLKYTSRFLTFLEWCAYASGTTLLGVAGGGKAANLLPGNVGTAVIGGALIAVGRGLHSFSDYLNTNATNYQQQNDNTQQSNRDMISAIERILAQRRALQPNLPAPASIQPAVAIQQSQPLLVQNDQPLHAIPPATLISSGSADPSSIQLAVIPHPPTTKQEGVIKQ